jgi:uncharacterized coiled-coil protein SlyX
MGITIEELKDKIKYQEEDVRDISSMLAQKRNVLQSLRGELLLKSLDLKLGDELRSEDGKKKGIIESANDEFHLKLRLYKADHTLGKNLINVYDSHFRIGRWVKTGYNINEA